MFRQMRRRGQALPPEVCVQILERGSFGVLALAGDDDYPYGVPLNYVYYREKIYFHCAMAGHKLDAIARNAKASFCVVDQDKVIPQEFATDYSSVIVFGRMRVLEDQQEKLETIQALGRKYAPEVGGRRLDQEIRKDWAALCMLELAPEHISGKEGRNLANRRRQGS